PTQISRWNVIDAASRNGTLVDGVPIQPNAPATLGGATRITVGEMALTFLSPAAFLRWLTKGVGAVCSPGRTGRCPRRQTRRGRRGRGRTPRRPTPEARASAVACTAPARG